MLPNLTHWTFGAKGNIEFFSTEPNNNFIIPGSSGINESGH